jgi:EPS-associated MarR family transcriptional regulator
VNTRSTPALERTPATEGIELDALRHLSSTPELTQRQLSAQLGLSLGRTNYVLQALLKKGMLKVRRFTNSNNKRAYAYMLTPKGWAAKARLTRIFLQIKVAEYEALREKIEALRSEANAGSRDE